ncbi:hypothetical protein EJ08DRAFT_695669 [Tothia fuscella]|uniref:Uncharacterized protein n=1 Tax=Tothia fuscella TaxID=1048955 RepID=A0A9P4U093_9PEZI|nr:hypothetical protein EJ08DRAFT_695669 [Tothia fuscella]
MLFKDFPQKQKDHLRQKEVLIRPLGIQRGHERFRNARNSHSRNGLPKLSTWRLNLIGLSQVHNLFFVAYIDKVHVYTPEYPLQSLSDKPALILSPPRTPTATTGYVDPLHPHSINNLFIDFLGDLEILLLACDDGDVLGYYVNEIQAAINHRDDSDGPDSIDGFDVRCFFQQNVNRSAWGLSIHSKSRKIAISANTHRVTVFTFGLITSEWIDNGSCPDKSFPLTKQDPLVVKREFDGEWVRLHCKWCQTSNFESIEEFFEHVDEWHGWNYNNVERAARDCGDITNAPPRPDHLSRDNDQKFELAPMRHNVPSVAFCNTDDDPTGRLLICGDILGANILWDLQHLQIVEFIKSEYCRGDAESCRCVGHYPHAIWSLSWLDKKSFRKFNDYAPLPNTTQVQDRLWNGDRAMQMTEHNANFSMWKARAQRHPNLVPAASADTDVSDQSEHSDDELPTDFEDDEELGPARLREVQQVQRDLAIADCYGLSSNGHPWDCDSVTAGKAFLDVAKEGPDLRQDVVRGKLRFPCPLFIASSKSTYMSQPYESGLKTKPFVTMSEPLEQSLIHDNHATIHLCHDLEISDRLSFQMNIPELGVLIVGSPKGRVAIFSLGQTTWNARRTKPVYFYRLDHLLPLKSQEDQGSRPESRLAGIAVSPVQGLLGHMDCGLARKWRLLLYYVDHSVLSYELSKKGKSVAGDDDMII